jgi:hypothetical protein
MQKIRRSLMVRRAGRTLPGLTKREAKAALAVLSGSRRRLCPPGPSAILIARQHMAQAVVESV